MFKRILVPLDGDTRAERALPIAARLARASSGSIMLLQAITPPIEYGGYLAQPPLLIQEVIDTYIDEAKRYLEQLAASDELKGIATTTKAVFGMPAGIILSTVRLEDIDLIVMCSHGRTGFKRWVLGSVAHKVVHHSPTPVLLLRDRELLSTDTHTGATRPLCGLVTLDGSPLAETVLEPTVNLVTALSAPEQGTLHLTQVVKLPAIAEEEGFVTEMIDEELEKAKAYLASTQERLQEATKESMPSITWSVALDTDIADALVGMAEHGRKGEQDEQGEGYDLIAMTTHGRGGLERWVMGSITERVLNATKLPMLIVRPQKAATKHEEHEDAKDATASTK